MGSGLSHQPRSAHYERVNNGSSSIEKPSAPSRVCDDARCVNISNKLVERLVEDGSLSRVEMKTKPEEKPKENRIEVIDKIFMEQLKTMDDTHSESLGLTIPELNILAARVERRIDSMFSTRPVCAGCQQDLVDCYADEANQGNYRKCASVIDAFKKCVAESTTSRLHERHERECVARAQRSRDVRRARESVLRDYVPRLVQDGAAKG